MLLHKCFIWSHENSMPHEDDSCGNLLENEPDYNDIFEFAKKVERDVFSSLDYTQAIYDYKTRICRVLFSLSINYNTLKNSQHNLSEICGDELVKGTFIEQSRHQNVTKEERFKAMLQEKFDQVEEETSKDALLQCMNCKSNNVVWTQRQTRSADEGMSVFAMCLKCNMSWKMS